MSCVHSTLVCTGARLSIAFSTHAQHQHSSLMNAQAECTFDSSLDSSCSDSFDKFLTLSPSGINENMSTSDAPAQCVAAAGVPNRARG